MGHNRSTPPIQLLQGGPAIIYQWSLPFSRYNGLWGQLAEALHLAMSTRLQGCNKEVGGCRIPKLGYGVFCMPPAPELTLG